nr:uncharacterized protein LOC111421993 [Onthophagus taurus]
MIYYAIQLSTNVNSAIIPHTSLNDVCINNLCENSTTDYSDDKIREILLKNQEFVPFFGNVLDVQRSNELKRPSRSLNNINDQKYNMCSTETITIFPRRGFTVDFKEKLIVNIPGYRQMVTYEACREHGKECYGNEYYPIGMSSICETQYILIRLVVLNEGEHLDLEQFSVPSGCSCMYKL